MAIEIQAKNPTIQMGTQGPRGERGPKGDPFTYDDFTPEQLESLKGPKGDPFTYDDFTPEELESLKGPKGDPFTYDDFTAEQLELLRGPKGPKGDAFTYNDFTPEQLAQLKGPKGDSFTYDDFTPEQLESLKGSKGDPFTYNDFTAEQLEQLKGPKGPKGDSFTYEDFTPEQLAQLKGSKGDPFTYNDFTEAQLESLKGPKGDKGDAFTYEDFTPEQLALLKGPKGDKGDAFTYNDFTPEELALLKGPKGDPFTYNDFTPEQLEQLKGPKGDAFTYDDFTAEQLALLKGDKGDKGDAFTYADFTEAQLESLKGPKGDAFTYEDFTPEQLEQLKGAKGDAFTYNDFTAEQLEQLKGPKGDKGDAFTYDDFTEAQLELLKGQKGDKGDAFTYADFTPEQLESLKGPKGDKGDAFTYADFTVEQLASLKGPKGDPFTYNDFTEAQLEQLKGPKGDPGPTYTAGTNITISADNVISATGGGGGSYTLPVATDYRLGGVKAMPTAVGNTGDDVLVDDDGRLHIPKATTLHLGAVKPDGTTIKIDTNGVISATGGSGGGSYTLPVASNNTLGGVKAPSEDITIKAERGYCYIDNNSRLYVPVARSLVGGAYGGNNAGVVLPSASQFEMNDNVLSLLPSSTTTLGGVKVDGTTTTTDEDGTIHAHYTLPTASTTTLGGVKVDGTSITIADGVISADLPTKTSDLTNDSGFITNEYHDATKQNVLVAGNNITIANDGTISASHPAQYIKSASVSGNTLNLTYNNDTSVVFTPTGGSGGGSGGVSGYAFSSTQVLTDTDKTHLKEIYNNKNIHMTIDGLTVIRIMSIGPKKGFVAVNTNGATSNRVLVYTVDMDSSGNITSNTLTLFMSYYLVGNSSQLTGDIITSDNWSQYISVSGNSWNNTTDVSTSDLYNAKDLMIKFTGSTGEISFFYGYFPDGLGSEQGSYYLVPNSTTFSGGYFQYNGSSIELYNTQYSISMIYYKT